MNKSKRLYEESNSWHTSRILLEAMEVNKIRIDKWSNNKYNDKNYKTFLYKFAKQTEALRTIILFLRKYKILLLVWDE